MINKAKNDKKKPIAKLRLARAGAGIFHELVHSKFDRAVAKTVLEGIKMSSPVLYDPLVHPLTLLAELKKLGLNALVWKPETLMAEIDRRSSDWSNEQISDAVEHFHNTGEIRTNVPLLTRQKLYALRVLMVSDTAHNEWHVFEKIGCAFNDRVPNFGIVEPLSPVECARTIAIIETVRPDQYSSEIKAYIGASCHQDGFYTIEPSHYLGVAEEYLEMMNREETGRDIDRSIVELIRNKFKIIRESASRLASVPDDFVTIQALKLLAIDHAGDEAARSL